MSLQEDIDSYALSTDKPLPTGRILFVSIAAVLVFVGVIKGAGTTGTPEKGMPTYVSGSPIISNTDMVEIVGRVPSGDRGLDSPIIHKPVLLAVRPLTDNVLVQLPRSENRISISPESLDEMLRAEQESIREKRLASGQDDRLVIDTIHDIDRFVGITKKSIADLNEQATGLSLRKVAYGDDAVGVGEDQQTVYGETLSTDDIREGERDQVIPHSNNSGQRYGYPVPVREQRIKELILQDNPLSLDEQLMLKRYIAEQERITHASVAVEQLTKRFTHSDSKTEVLKVAKNNLATLAFTDKNGHPYPVIRVSPEKAGPLFSVTKIDGEGTAENVVEITGKTLSGESNISVMLAGRTLPIMYKVVMTESENYGKSIIQLNQSAPGRETAVLPAANMGAVHCKADNVIESVLDGVIPSSLSALTTGIRNTQAFTDGRNNYIRSQHQIVTPDCDCVVYGVDSLNVCRVAESKRTLLLMPKTGSVEGNSIQTLRLGS